jgi:hypothetical protein
LIDRQYRVWTGVPGLDDDDNDNDSDIDDSDCVSDDSEDPEFEESLLKTAAYANGAIIIGKEDTYPQVVSKAIPFRNPMVPKGTSNNFATSSLSSALSVIEQDDMAMSIASSSVHNGSMTQSPMVITDLSSYARYRSRFANNNDVDNIHDDYSDEVHDSYTTGTNITSLGREGTETYQNHQWSHGTITTTALTTTNLSLGYDVSDPFNDTAMSSINGKRRPRFYSIGSTGSW